MGRKKETVRSLAMACSLLTSCFVLACQRAVLSALAGYNAETEDEERFPRTILTYLLMDMLMDYKMQLNEKHRLGLFELLILPSPFTVPIHPVLLKISIGQKRLPSQRIAHLNMLNIVVCKA
jgi:hypothetical protein